MLFVGLGLFSSALASQRRDRLITGTPLAKCGTVGKGYAALEGVARVDSPATAPFSGRTCVFAAVTIERAIGGGRWTKLASFFSPSHPSFMLDDGSGAVIVLPHLAKLALESAQIDPVSAPDSLLGAYGVQRGPEPLRVTEQLLELGAQVYVQGTVIDAATLPEDLGGGPAAKAPLAIWHGGAPFVIAAGDRAAYECTVAEKTRVGSLAGPALAIAGLGVLAWAAFLIAPETDVGRAAASGDVAGVVHALGSIPQRARDREGMTPLMRAAQSADARSVRTDIARGAQLDALDDAGLTALRYAVRSGSEESTEVLLAAHADVEMPDRNGDTALHDAAALGNVAIVRDLLAAGADPTARDIQRRRPLDVAIAAHEDAAAALLADRR